VLTPAIETRHVTRVFRRRGAEPVTALDDVSLRVDEGEVVALLGENGAGKTTFTKILCTLLLPTSGDVEIFGFDVVRQARQVRECSTAVFGGDRGLYGLLSARENLRYFGAIDGIPARELKRRIPVVLETVGLAAAGDRRVEEYSKGMKQRLQIAVGFLARPRLLLLDEPTVGLDPLESEHLRHMVAEIVAEGTTVLLTSHNLLDVERLAARVVMIQHGRLTMDLPVTEFRALAGYAGVAVATLRPGATPDLLPGWTRTEATDCVRVEVPVKQWDAEVLRQVTDRLGADLVSLEIREASLDDAFARAIESS